MIERTNFYVDLELGDAHNKATYLRWGFQEMLLCIFIVTTSMIIGNWFTP
jgi:hypothetical protein